MTHIYHLLYATAYYHLFVRYVGLRALTACVDSLHLEPTFTLIPFMAYFSVCFLWIILFS